MIEGKAATKFVKIMPSEPSVSTEPNLLKKASTKMMIIDALKELKTRKGVSVQAIKKFMSEKYQADTEKLNFIIKKTLKSGVEDGTFQQLKGIGASGSFKLINTKEKKAKKSKPKEKSEKEPKEKSEKLGEKTKMKAPVKESSQKEKQKKEKKVTDTKKEKPKLSKTKKEGSESTTKAVKKQKIEKSEVKVVKEKPKKKMAKGLGAQGKSQDTSIIRRKSIGSIIKPPKMKPKGIGHVN